MNALQRVGIGAAVLLLIAGVFAPRSSEASHFRYGTLSWTPLGNGEVEFSVVIAFRRDSNGFTCVNFGPGDGTCDGADGNPVTGDVILEGQGDTAFNFDNSTSTGTLRFEIIDHSVSGNWIIGVALDPDTEERGLLHTYSESGPITAFVEDCCRISNLNNRSSPTEYRLETTVFPNSSNSSPATSLSPIVKVEEDVNQATFTIPASDDEGDELRFRLANEGEATEGGPNDGVPSFSIDQNTGVVTLNTNDLSGSADFWTEQVIVEELDQSGNVRTKIPIDFFIQEVPKTGNPPAVAISKSCPITVEPGNTTSFDVEATDPDNNETLSLNLNSPLPSGASMSPSLPISGSPTLTSTFSWTPTQSQVGQSKVLNYTAEDSDSQQDQESCTVEVVEQSQASNEDGRIDQQGNPQAECDAVAAELGTGPLEPFAKYENPNDPNGGFVDDLLGDGDDITFDPDPPTVPSGSWESTTPIAAFLIKQKTFIDYWADPGTSLSYTSPEGDYSHLTFCVSEGFECDSPTLGQDDINKMNRTLSNTIQDDEGVSEFTFSTLENFTVASISPSSGFDRSGNTWTWTGSGTPPTSVDFTLEAGSGTTSTYFLEVTDACIDPNTVTFDPSYELGTAVSQPRLAGNAPNPFSGETTVRFALPEQARVTVAVYDMMGRKVATLVDEVRPAGTHAVRWDGQSANGQDLASGMYLMRMQAGGQSSTKRVTIVR